MEITTILVGILVALVVFMWFRRHDPRMPPCPVPPMPLFGHLLYMDKNPRPQFKNWRKKCGDIYSLYLGGNLVVVLNGYDLIKKAIVEQGDISSDRPYIFFDAVTGTAGQGIVFSSGAVWREHRAVTVNILRSLGMGKNVLTQKVTEIALINNDVLARLNGEPTDIDDILTTSVANIICSIMMGNRFEHDDHKFLSFCQEFRENVLQGDGRNLANYFLFWEYIPGDLFNAKKIKARTDHIMSDFVAPFVQKKGYDEYDENNLDNFIDRYVYEMKRKQKAGEATTMSDANLRKVVFDLFGAGLETTATSLKWCIFYFLHHPEMQERVYRELEREVGTARQPNINDKYNLPYLNAFTMEVQRITSIVPLNVLHRCTEDVTVGGYTLPKGTTIMPSLDSILFDKKTWGKDANVFNPDRFLDENGKVMNLAEFVPFSLGKRMCPGEALAKVEMFLYLALMVHRFKFLPEDPKSLPSTEVQFGITANPAQYKVRVVERLK